MEPARKFKIIVNSKECGTCSGPTPSAVAKKVVKKLCGTSSKVVKFSLKECKRGCERECGPYQGRMEKLDKPYTRTGKKITHRVVCWKVRKMRGGALGVKKFKKSEADDDFKFDTDFFKPVIFFGDIEGKERDEEDEKTYYEFAIFNKEHRGGPVGILQLEENNGILVVKTDIEEIFDPPAASNNAEQHNAVKQYNASSAPNKLKKELKEKLKKLYEVLKQDKTKYKRIRGFICDILDIDENNNIPEIFKREIPTDLPDGFDYIPYVAYQNQISNELKSLKKNFDINLLSSNLPKKKDNFNPIGKKKILQEKIPEMVRDYKNRDYSLDYYKSDDVYLFFFDDCVYFSNVINSEYYSIIFINDCILYIGIVYNYNRNIVVIFYPILNVYSPIISLELDFIYSVYYSFFIMNRLRFIWSYYKTTLCQFYVEYISKRITYDTLKKICVNQMILNMYEPSCEYVDFNYLLKLKTIRKNKNLNFFNV